jgi:rod shape-determining protein MreC
LRVQWQVWSRLINLIRVSADCMGIMSLMVIALACLLLGRITPAEFDAASARIADIAAPALTVINAPPRALSGWLEALGWMRDAHAANAPLRDENLALRQAITEAERLVGENRDLRRLLRLGPPPGAIVVATARVISDAGGPFVRAVLIDAGAAAGIGEGMTAITGDGLVGRVVNVGQRSARIVLLTDLSSYIPVRIEPRDSHAILSGGNDDLPLLTFLPPSARLQIGDRVITSGSDGVLPRGIVVGHVQKLDGTAAAVRPAVDWRGLDHVMLLATAPIGPPEGTPPDIVGGYPDQWTRPATSLAERLPSFPEGRS